MKRLLTLLGLLLALATPAHAAQWKGAGVIAASPAFTATVDQNGDALFAGTLPDARLFTVSRLRGGSVEPTQPVAPYYYLGNPKLAGNGAGAAVLAWPQSEVDDPTRLEMAALREPGGEFGPPQTLFRGNSTEYLCDDATAISDSGAAIVVFAVALPNDFTLSCRLLAAVRQPGADHFDEPVELSSFGASYPQAAFDASGNALIAWYQRLSKTDGSMANLTVARYSPAEGGFQPAQTLAIRRDAGRDAALLLRVSPGGAAIVAWPSARGAGLRIAAAIGDTQSGFGAPAALSGPVGPDQRQRRFDAAAGADGTRAVVWLGGRKNHRRVQVARVGPGAETITARDTNTVSAKRAVEAALAITDEGRVTVAWSRYLKFPGPLAVEVASAAPSKHFGRAQRLSSNGTDFGALPALGTNSRGGQFLAWTEGWQALRTAHWAKAPTANGRFGQPRRMVRPRWVGVVRLLRGASGAMLATIRRDLPAGTKWSLFTYGER